MAYDEKLAQRVRRALSGQEGIIEKKMFGGLAFMLHGNMSCGVHQDRLMVRVGPERYEEALARPHTRVMDLTRRPLKGFVFVFPEGLQSGADLEEWVGLGVEFARSLPRK